MAPTYLVSVLRLLFRKENRIITQTAINGALEVGHGTTDIEECICETLQDHHFYKTMRSEKMPALWQDVYKLTHLGVALYVKVQIRNNQAVLVSYKRDESVQ